MKVISKIKHSNGKREIHLFGKKIFSYKKIKKYLYNGCDTLSYYEKALIKKSPLWDPLWYIRKYHNDMNLENSLNYWITQGYKNNEDPSPLVDVKYLNKILENNFTPQILITYLMHNAPFSLTNKNGYKSDNDKQRIADYLEYKKNRKSKSVVYTCITNDYDDIREIAALKVINKDWDYVCFTDNKKDIEQKQIGIWDIRPLEFDKLDNTRNNRWHKLNPHLLFPDYDESLYIDANINIISDYIFNLIEEKKSNFLVPKHFKNVCIYSEYDNVMSANLDVKEKILAELDIIKKDNMPRNYGFCENNILYRKHNEKTIKHIDEQWWKMVYKYAKRDQLSLAYLLWKNKISIESITFENARLSVDNFCVFGHRKDRILEEK